MDTRFWGPPAWIMLHSIARNYDPKYKEEYKTFFTNLKYVLPCIYCRASMTEYIEELPIDAYLENQDKFFEWLYHIHNKVNNKLRGQGLIEWINPSLTEIKAHYEHVDSEMTTCQVRDKSLMAWNFLYCIAFVFPETGMNDALTSTYHGYIVFFNMLQYLLPGKYQVLYTEYLTAHPIMDGLKNRESLKQWIYNLELFFNTENKTNCASFIEIEDLIESYRAGCGGSKTDSKPTCRRVNK
jgi:hypothetical protein